jgi:hypothetical protein
MAALAEESLGAEKAFELEAQERALATSPITPKAFMPREAHYA